MTDDIDTVDGGRADMKPHPHWLLRARIAHERLNDDGEEEDE